MSKQPEVKNYYHSRYKGSPPKEWLKDRMKHPTGFCNPYQPLQAQSHEGDKLFTADGRPRPTCLFWDSCPCMCHYQIDQMYEMAGMEREPAEYSPEYSAHLAEQSLKTEQMLDSLPNYVSVYAPLSNAGGTIPPASDEGPGAGSVDSATDTPAPVAGHAFAPTPTGRRARGQLEYDVLLVCIDFANNVFDWSDCTPKNVSEEIGRRYKIEPPSTGAINAVWDRWERLEFADQAKKPSRFVKFRVDNPSAATLDVIKARAKRAKKMAAGEQRRGIPRPVRRGK